MAEKSATLQIGNNNFDFPIRTGSIGPDVIDITTLYKNTDCFTFDPGFTSTASCESAITYIDGDAGVLLHRGYPIDQLAEHGSFLETCYLLLYEELPTVEQLADFYSAFGVEKDAYIAHFNSFAADSQMRKGQRDIGQFGIKGTPSLVVNRKYRVESNENVANFEDMLAVVNYLAEIEQAQQD